MGVEGEVVTAGSLTYGFADGFFGGGVEEVDGEDVFAGAEFVADVAFEGGSGVFGEEDGVFFFLAPVDEGLEEGSEVPDGDIFLDHALEDFGNFLDGEDALDFADDFREGGLHFFEEELGFLDAHEVAGVFS